MLPLPISAGEKNWQQIRFREVDTLFANPGQGWMSQRFPCSVVYLRFNWADVEPEEGHYNWNYIDDAIAACRPRGAAVAMRVMTANAHTRGYYCSPKWLFDLGCKGFDYTVGGADPTSGGRRIPRIEPDYSDPIYLAKQENFIAALGNRYDGNPNVEFLDIGSYGIWGEWHSSHPASILVRKQIVDMYSQNSAGQTLAAIVANADPREWLPGEQAIVAQMMIPTGLPSGQYDLAVTIADKNGQRPPLTLAMDATANKSSVASMRSDSIKPNAGRFSLSPSP
jgi:hypothetical protein